MLDMKMEEAKESGSLFSIKKYRDLVPTQKQLIMGAGKSKVLTPVLALAESKPGEMLSIIILPEPLFDSGSRQLYFGLMKLILIMY